MHLAALDVELKKIQANLQCEANPKATDRCVFRPKAFRRFFLNFLLKVTFRQRIGGPKGVKQSLFPSTRDQCTSIFPRDMVEGTDRIGHETTILQLQPVCLKLVQANCQ